MEQKKENIVMFPFMAQGHIRPFLALALQIEQKKNYTITFVNTPLNIKKLRPSLPPNSSIRLLEIPFCSSDHGLPPDTENTDVLPHLIAQLVLTSRSFKPAFRTLISNLTEEQNGHPPLCIIADMLFSWTSEIAHEFGAFNAIFNAGGGYGMGVFHSLWLNLPHLTTTNSNEFSIPGFPESSWIRVNQIPEHLRTIKRDDPFVEFIHRLFKEWLESDGFLFNTVEEFDRTGLEYFRQTMSRPVWPIGPARAEKQPGLLTWERCEKWLNSKPENSVLYVSFGSQSTISLSQMMELAMALEGSDKDFIWVVRPPLGFDINSEFNAEEWLPKGFEERVLDKNRGLLVHNWAPQVEILSHKSVSGFLSHCGWNSVLEAISHGVPIIAWPIMAEQHFNSKMLEEEKGICVEVGNEEGGGSVVIRHEEIMEKIELVMGEEEKGKEMRRKAREVKEMIENAVKDEDGFKGSSVKAIDEFLNAAILFREKAKIGQKNEV